jgi:hypothetical protein
MALTVTRDHVRLPSASPPLAANEDEIKAPKDITTDKSGEESDGDLEDDM